MRQGVPVEIGGREFRVPRWAIVLGVIGVLGAAGVFAVQIAQGNLEDYADEQQAAADLEDYEAAVEQTNILRAGCVTSNALRFSAWANSTIDAKTRFAAAPQYTAQAKADIIHLAKLNVHAAGLLVDAVAEAPLEPGSPMRDCASIYAAPKAPDGIEAIPLDPLPTLTVPDLEPATIPPQYR